MSNAPSEMNHGLTSPTKRKLLAEALAARKVELCLQVTKMRQRLTRIMPRIQTNMPTHEL